MKHFTKYFYLIILLFLLFPLWLFFNSRQQTEVIFLDIGQGDSALIKLVDGQDILIDGGPDQTVLEKLSQYLPWWDKDIELMILTHPHADHVTGLNVVLDNYQVDNIVETGVYYSEPSALAWREKIDNNFQNKIILADQTLNFDFGDCQLQVLYPDHSFQNMVVDNLNNTSLVSKLICGQTRWLFTGDIEQETEHYLVEHNVNLEADVLKVPHHGSKTSSTQEFLKAVQPKIAIIPAGKDNIFNFPDKIIVHRLQRYAQQVLITGQEGDLDFLTNGQEIWRK